MGDSYIAARTSNYQTVFVGYEERCMFIMSMAGLDCKDLKNLEVLHDPMFTNVNRSINILLIE